MTPTQHLSPRVTLPLALITVFLHGCSDLNEALNTEPKRRIAAVPGIASTNDIQDVQDAAGGNSPTSPAPTQAAPSPAQAAPTPAQAAPATSNTSPTEQPAPRSRVIGRTTSEVIDYKRYRSNPFIVVVENKIQGSDPLTIAATAYVSVRSRASALNFKRQLDIIKAMEGRAPTFAEFKKLQKQLRIELAQLYQYQAYAYDESTGGLLVVENKEFKIQLYREAGIPIEAGDKVYEQKLKSRKSQQPGKR